MCALGRLCVPLPAGWLARGRNFHSRPNLALRLDPVWKIPLNFECTRPKGYTVHLVCKIPLRVLGLYTRYLCSRAHSAARPSACYNRVSCIHALGLNIVLVDKLCVVCKIPLLARALGLKQPLGQARARQ